MFTSRNLAGKDKGHYLRCLYRAGFKRYIDAIVEHLKGFVLALIALVSVLGIIVGYKYYRHTQDDPEFCMSCHMMKEAFNAWSRSRHRDIVCQKCHHLSLFEQNRLLVSFVSIVIRCLIRAQCPASSA
ncbi:MAG: NapC/NirT family cytochrome c, partial [Nitrospirota bacterium]